MLAFLRRNQVLLTSFLCLLLSLYILSAAARGRLQRDPIGPLLLGLMRPFQIGAQVTVVKLKEIRQRYFTWRSMASENERLKVHITELEGERNQLLEVESTNRRLQELLELEFCIWI